MDLHWTIFPKFSYNLVSDVKKKLIILRLDECTRIGELSLQIIKES